MYKFFLIILLTPHVLFFIYLFIYFLIKILNGGMQTQQQVSKKEGLRTMMAQKHFVFRSCHQIAP